AEELPPLDAGLTRLARVVEDEALREDLPRFFFQVVERGHERNALRNDSLDAHGVQLLEALQVTRLGRRLQRRERRERDELVVRAFHVDLRELIRSERLRPLDLGDDLVTASLDAEPVDVVPAEKGREILARLRKV